MSISLNDRSLACKSISTFIYSYKKNLHIRSNPVIEGDNDHDSNFRHPDNQIANWYWHYLTPPRSPLTTWIT